MTKSYSASMKLDSAIVQTDSTHDPRTLTDTISAKISMELADRMEDNLRHSIFGGASPQELNLLFKVLLNDPHIRDKMIAERTRQRLLANSSKDGSMMERGS